ncbi:HAMP domain-containing protein [Deinococcus deserti]|uniref:HAMP domain protein putative membrane protein n=1 Tax=Deinococcus deserti (strain DSM 17065 / CIP 109153 / LMG 22923 / VCD115) TaxID=546414 RepID=C1CW59_DEIDV|nr:HAMP domain-containing protein [Deinococcus deserti]ACO46426.1 HAMP domain protein; putative membrane protein [Deinococcus deserti VCD115]
MKYTVVIRQPVPEESLPALEGQLTERFGLNPEQAKRLASRRGGRLMKPTGRARAELLLSVFESIGAQVVLEEVREETGLLSEPFQGVASRAPTSAFAMAGASGGSTAVLDDAPLAAPVRSQPEPIWASGATASSSASMAGWNEEPTSKVSAFSEASMPAATTADPFSAVATATPAAPFLPDAGSAEQVPMVTTPAAGQTTAEPQGVTPTAAPETDAWSDFTGALTISDNTPAKTVAEPAAVITALNEEPGGVSTKRRRSLAQQLTVSTLTPLLLSTGLTLGLLSLILPGLQRQLVQQNAQAVAVAVGTSLDTRNQESVNLQLDTLLSRSAVGFVRVELPDGTTYFRSRNPAVDSIMQARVAEFVRENPNSGTFQSSGSAADAYREQLKQLEDVGAGESTQAQELRAAIQDPSNSKADRTAYVTSRLGVVETEDGSRSTVTGATDSEDLLYRISVGVPNTQAATNLRNTLLLVLAVSLLALGLAAALALRAARRVVEPIERLVKVADAISMGDLTHPVQAERNDEIGDLANALERMRLSLEAAMERLRRRKRS